MNSEAPLILALGGYSESGKSSAGRYFESCGFARLKIASFYKKIYESEVTSLSFVEWSAEIEREKPAWIAAEFLRLLLDALSSTPESRCTIESLYGDVLALELRKLLGSRFIVLYMYVDDDIRLKRQQLREGFGTLEEAATFMAPRDAMKRAWGADRLRGIADFVVDNSSSLEELQKRLEDVLSRIEQR